jgi:hypothetical protein
LRLNPLQATAPANGSARTEFKLGSFPPDHHAPPATPTLTPATRSRKSKQNSFTRKNMKRNKTFFYSKTANNRQSNEIFIYLPRMSGRH